MIEALDQAAVDLAMVDPADLTDAEREAIHEAEDVVGRGDEPETSADGGATSEGGES